MAGNTNLKTPPLLSEEGNYTEWKNDLAIWQLYTDLDKKKRGPAVYLSLSGRAREAVRSIPAADLGGDDGLKLITNKLDGILEQDKNTSVSSVQNLL